jgi:recombination associated protein RdgC
MFKSLIAFRIAADWEPPATEALEAALAQARFTPCEPSQTESCGWVQPRGEKHAPLVECVGGQLILKLRTEVRGVPGAAVNEALEKRLADIEQSTGHRPRGAAKKALKEEVTLDLLPRAFSKFSATMVWIDPKAKLLVVDAGSVAKADKVVSAIADAMAKAERIIKLHLVQTVVSPGRAMSDWLATQEAPAGFTTDRECELADSESKAKVRYTKHSLDIEEIRQHIEGGKLATRLAMTWDSRVSFVLTDSLGLTKIEMLDCVIEAQQRAAGDGKDNSGFDADVALVTGELRRLLPDLLQALGGETPSERTGVPAPVAVPTQPANDSAIEETKAA